jgi:hypothetical protein
MTIIETPPPPAKRRRGAPEMKIQAECVKVAWNEFPETRYSLFHVANEVDRPDANAMLGARRRAEGIVRGVSDLILMLPRKGYHALCIEMKTETGYQSSFQKDWQKIVESNGYRYVVCRSVEQFRDILTDYLR